MPATWSELPATVRPEAGLLAPAWWTLFHDPTLDSLIREAMSANLDLRIAETRIREARAQRNLAAAAGSPSVDAAASHINTERSENSLSGGSSSNLYQIGFDAGWELDIFGGIRREIEAADALVDASVEDQRTVLVSLQAEVARNYLEMRGSRQRLATARSNISSQTKTVDLVRGLHQLGLGSELQLVQANTQLALLNAQVPGLERSTRQSLHQLALLLGRQPQDLPAALAEETSIPPLPPEIPINLPSDLLRQRPDIRRAERQLAAATATVGATTADLFPRFSLTALVGLQSTSLTDLVTSSSRFWTIGPAIRWALFDGGRIRAAIDVSEARRERAQATYEKTILSSLADAADALVALTREKETLQILAAAVNSGEQSLAMSRGLYEAGLVDFLNVLQAERALYASRDQLVQSELRLSLGMVALFKALGGGWNLENQPATPFTGDNGAHTLPPKG